MTTTPLRWTYDARTHLHTALTTGGGTYRVMFSGYRWLATLGGLTIGGGGDVDTAKQAAQHDYDLRQQRRQARDTVVPAGQLIDAMTAAIDTAYTNLTPGAAIPVAAAMEAVAEAVGIDPASLRSANRP
jgi:hypothetical protein